MSQMTNDTEAVKAELRDALLRSCNQLVAHLAQWHGTNGRIPGMSWGVGELGAHLVTNMRELSLALRAEPCAYDGAYETGTMGVIDDRLVEGFAERDAERLSVHLSEQLDEFSSALESAAGNDPVHSIAPHATVNAIAAIFVLDHHNHGSQLAAAGGPSWLLELGDVRLALVSLLPSVVDRDAIAEFRGSFAVTLRGTDAINIAVDRGDFEVDGPLTSVDCKILSDPIAFLRMNAGGFMSRRRAVLSGKLFAYGIKPWKLIAFGRLIKQVQHGGRL